MYFCGVSVVVGIVDNVRCYLPSLSTLMKIRRVEVTHQLNICREVCEEHNFPLPLKV